MTHVPEGAPAPAAAHPRASMPCDADLLALCVWTEAQGEPADGMAAVAQVVLHRMHLRYASDGAIPGTTLQGRVSAFGFDFVHGAYH